MAKAKLKQRSGAVDNKEVFTFDKLKSGDVKISFNPKHFEIMTKGEFDSRFEEIKEEIQTEQSTT